ncbi:hypothetical protein [Streptomyces griseus]|uniref:hypothetical protein n=1 Tax=Streptomyces griseus TaxID=1911 RepID=UPI0020C82787|nr:hypothetical protein [Streptomyces griseus]
MHDDITAIRGLSSAALAEVRRIERQKKYLWPGSIASAMVRWRSFVPQPDRRLWEYESGGCAEWPVAVIRGRLASSSKR